MLLKNKVAVVTGCNRGIGKKIIEVFSSNGANIFACVRKLDNELPYSSNIIEIGCGTGQLSNFLSRYNRTIIGTDISLNSLRQVCLC